MTAAAAAQLDAEGSPAQRELGDVTIRVEHADGPLRRRRIWLHDYFEARLEEECLRAESTAAEFSVIRVRCKEPEADLAVRDALTAVLRVFDVIGRYAPGEVEVLVVDTPADRAFASADRIRERLDRLGIVAGVGLASFPADGRGPDALQQRSAERAHAKGTLSEPAPVDTVTAMSRIHGLVAKIAPSSINVLLLGETGVGKEVVAERIHAMSDRKGHLLLRINCAALTETLLESELFGHERGAFSGAVATKRGLLETGDGGTIFLDEVGDLPMSLQAKLLRVIEDHTVRRVGGLEPRTINVRFIAATNRDLEAEIKQKQFRQDLFFRLNGVTIQLPPLRERVSEIEALAYLFVNRFTAEVGRGSMGISEDAMALLKWYSWPGNIRELRNVIERAVILSHDDMITTDDLPVAKIRATYASTSHDAPITGAPPRSASRRVHTARPWPTGHTPTSPSRTKRAPDDVHGELDQLERAADQLMCQRIEEALAACHGNQTYAARMLGISRGTLLKRLDRYRIGRPRQPRKPR